MKLAENRDFRTGRAASVGNIIQIFVAYPRFRKNNLATENTKEAQRNIKISVPLLCSLWLKLESDQNAAAQNASLRIEPQAAFFATYAGLIIKQVSRVENRLGANRQA